MTPYHPSQVYLFPGMACKSIWIMIQNLVRDAELKLEIMLREF
jgi:hypothetical protein